MDWMSLMGMLPGLSGGMGPQEGMFSGANTQGGFGQSVGNPIAGAFGGGPSSGINISNGMIPPSTMPQAGAYGLYQAQDPNASSDVDFGAAQKALGLLGSGGAGGQPAPLAGGMGGAMGGGGGNTKGLFSSLMRSQPLRQVSPTAGLLNILG